MEPGNAENLTPLDRDILNIIQGGFPISSRPFQEIAGQVGATEEEVLARVKALKEGKIIRRLGGIFDSGQLGFFSTLTALQVRGEKLEQVAEQISALSGVTHNYQRDHEFNLWFTLTCPSSEELEQTLSEIEKMPGIIKLRRLPALRLFKIGVNLQL